MASPGGGGGDTTPAREKDDTAAAEEADKEYLNEMRGWLMTVATLFIGLAFEAMLHPPEWFKTEWYQAGGHMWPFKQQNAAGVTRGEIWKGMLYLSFNAWTFGTAVAIVVVLLWTPNKASFAKPVLTYVSRLLTLLSTTVAFTFAMATADSWKVTGLVFGAAVVYALVIYCMYRRLIRGKAPAPPETSSHLPQSNN